jgi:hypothetical protein
MIAGSAWSAGAPVLIDVAGSCDQGMASAQSRAWAVVIVSVQGQLGSMCRM